VFLFVIMFTFGYLAPLRRLAGKIITEMADNVSSGTLSQLSSLTSVLLTVRVFCGHFSSH